MPIPHSKLILKFNLTEINRFWDKVDMSGGADACWNWLGYVRPKGYGICSFRSAEYKAHRVAFFLEHGRINEKLFVLHSCDNRRCCNPRHLKQGTPKQNAHDAVKKGRNIRLHGEQNDMVKLTRKQVKSIRKMLKDKADGKCSLFQYQIARYHGVSEATVSYLKNGGRWNYVPID